jgi:hypothetical protein
VPAERILIDDWDGCAEAHRRQLLDFETALARLSRTNFYLSTELIDLVRKRLSRP